ncbi:MAG: phenylacetate--CoA ligase family protein [Rhodospirillaceae bacterium]|nr:phenylacetate--CoA ligase family protein [Rhodospirillaceae bacterium]
MSAGDFYDSLETRSPEAREAALMAALGEQVANAKARSAWYASLFKDVDPRAVTSRAALAQLPVTRKHDLIALMKERPPMGGLNALPLGEAALIFTSPGPIFEYATDRPDFYDAARALYAAGIRKGDVVHNSFSYHLTPGAWVMHSAARAMGCPVIPGGVGNTEQQVQVMAQIGPAAYAGTPDFLKILLETADRLGLRLASVTKALVGGGPLFPQLRDFYRGRGIQCLQSFATAELGNIAYESPALDGLIVAESKIVEVLVPGTRDPVAEPGQVGELVVTSLNPDFPLVRFSTGDLTAVLPGQSPCGRTNMRIKGWMGRADQTAKVRGMFVHPEQVAEVMKRHPEVKRARLVIDALDGLDQATFRIAAAATNAALAEAVARSFQAVCKVRATVEFVASEKIPNDGKLIEDVRKVG